ncbi:hypothetical protein [Brucella intermedia]|uniref:hypothetical protein n=1 Tax=Brucella intermedia TaxID=94625 RepID=UPI00236012FB|nr:hypothetical protein [Brucella intermedia]
MPSKELIENVARAIADADMEDYMKSTALYDAKAQAAISTIRAVLQEPTEGVLLAAKGFGDTQAWQEMLNASALGEQSDG